MELNKKTFKHALILITFAIFLFWGLNHPSYILIMGKYFLDLLSPFLIGFCIAFVIDILLCPLENFWSKIFLNRKNKWTHKLKRPVCLLLSTLIVLGIIFAVVFMILPELQQTVMSFLDMLPGYLLNLDKYWTSITKFFENYSIVLPEFDFKPEEVLGTIGAFLAEKGQIFFDKTIDITTSIFSGVVTIVMAFVFSLYLLGQKETLGGQLKRVLLAFISEEKVEELRELAVLTDRTFSNFVTGQLTEAVILAALCCIGMLIFDMPYAFMISVLIGATALVPVFGAFVGAFIGAFLILLISPAKAFWFLIFIIVLQQLEGNLIYPRVVGKSVGLPGIWVLVAVSVGGNIFGMAGMLMSVPLCSVLYTLAVEGVRRRLKKRGLIGNPSLETDSETEGKKAKQ